MRPTSAVRQYTGLEQNPLAAGREQQVDAVLEGSLQRSGESVRVTVRLLNVRDGSPIWAYQSGEQPWTGIFAVQDAISEEVVQAMRLTLTGQEKAQLTKRYTENPETYQLYLKGRLFLDKRTTEALTRSREFFEQAIEKDPKYPLAYAGLSDASDLLRDFPAAKAAAIKALEMDDTLAEVHASLGRILIHADWDWTGSEREFKRAVELNPN